MNPAGSVTPVTDQLLDEARERAEVAAARMREVEHADPSRDSWAAEYEAAAAAARATSRRVEGLERLRAAQIERSGKRDATAKAAAGDLKSIAAGLAATRDAIAAAAAEHLKSLAALAVATEAHNARLAQGRARIAELGLRVHDDLADGGAEHGEGIIDTQGLRAEGTDWTPVPAGGVTAHALRQVFAAAGPGHPLAAISKYGPWRSFEVETRADGLKVPTLKDVGAVIPPGPAPMVIPDRPSIRDLIPTAAELEQIAEKRRREKVADHRAKLLARGGAGAAR